MRQISSAVARRAAALTSETVLEAVKLVRPAVPNDVWIVVVGAGEYPMGKLYRVSLNLLQIDGVRRILPGDVSGEAPWRRLVVLGFPCGHREYDGSVTWLRETDL